jgi:predicted RNA-binding protein with PIN domain
VKRALIDGHNAIQVLRIHGSDHREARRRLLKLARDLGNDPTVFFDARGAPPDLSDPAHEDGVRVVYCRDREADAAIYDAVLDAMEPRHLLVVTDDRELAGRVRSQGAVTRSIRAYFERAQRRHAPDTDDAKPEGSGGWRPEDFGLPDEVDLDRPPRGL